MDKVEKFKELLDWLLMYCENEEVEEVKSMKEFLIKRRELIKLYEKEVNKNE